MARIPLDPPRTLSYRLASWFSRRRYQDMLDPVTVMPAPSRAAVPMASSRCRVTARGRSITG